MYSYLRKIKKNIFNYNLRRKHSPWTAGVSSGSPYPVSNKRGGVARVPECDLKKSNTLTVRLKLPGFRLQYFVHSSGNTDPSQGICRGERSHSTRSVTLYSLNFSNWLTARSRMSVPLIRETGHQQEKTHVKVSRRTKEHLRTVTHCYTRKRIQTLYGNEMCQTSTKVAPARCKCGERLKVWTTKPLRSFQTEYITLLSLPF
jgi:hypothetical protein